jgi:hypothetical protein
VDRQQMREQIRQLDVRADFLLGVIGELDSRGGSAGSQYASAPYLALQLAHVLLQRRALLETLAAPTIATELRSFNRRC